MTIITICPKCESENTEYVNYFGNDYLFCHDCGYDERLFSDNFYDKSIET